MGLNENEKITFLLIYGWNLGNFKIRVKLRLKQSWDKILNKMKILIWQCCLSKCLQILRLSNICINYGNKAYNSEKYMKYKDKIMILEFAAISKINHHFILSFFQTF